MLRIAALFMLVGCAVFARDTKPSMVFSQTEFDFGTIEQGEKVTHTFNFKNAGDAVLEIANVAASCGCTSAKPDKLSYNPGEEGAIPVTFDSTRFTNQISKTVTVTSNDPAQPKIVLKIKGTILVEINTSPTSVMFSNLKRSESMAHDVLVSTEMLDKLEVSELQSDLAFLSLKTEKRDNKTLVLKASVNGQDVPKDKDAFQGKITFKTNGKKKEALSVPVLIRMAQPIVVSPSSVYFFASTKGKAREATVRLAPAEDKKLEILALSSDLDFVKAEKVEGDDIKLKVTLLDSAASGKFSGMITVKTNMADKPSLQIPIRGSVL